MIGAGEHTAISADGTRVGYRTIGEGEPVIVVGGALRTGEDYLPLAHALSRRLQVHVMDRRGRGLSGPQGSHYSIEKECEDLDAVIAATGASRVFGHSYGGLVALETAKRTSTLARLAVYEPGVSVHGSIVTGWMPEYSRRLARGDSRGAFAVFVRGSGHAPAMVTKLPLGYLKLVLRFAIRPAQWQRIEPLLAANLTEHNQVRRLDGIACSYQQLDAHVLLLGGTNSRTSSLHTLDALNHHIPHAALELIDGLAHNAPDGGSPNQVAERVEPFLAAA
jgi:pimeloyl-ACP methyl ester carboxylesterase